MPSEGAVSAAETVAFAGEPVDLEMLEEEHARYNPRPDESKLALCPHPTHK